MTPATEPASPPTTPTDYGWLRVAVNRAPGVHSVRVVWLHPHHAPGAVTVYATPEGVGFAGQFFDFRSAHNLARLFALAAFVSKQLTAGVELSALTFQELSAS